VRTSAGPPRTPGAAVAGWSRRVRCRVGRDGRGRHRVVPAACPDDLRYVRACRHSPNSSTCVPPRSSAARLPPNHNSPGPTASRCAWRVKQIRILVARCGL
jgi:hypothetical protein